MSKDWASLNSFLEKNKFTNRYAPRIPIATNPFDSFRSLNNILTNVSIINESNRKVVLKNENRFFDISAPLILSVYHRHKKRNPKISFFYYLLFVVFHPAKCTFDCFMPVLQQMSSMFFIHLRSKFFIHFKCLS